MKTLQTSSITLYTHMLVSIVTLNFTPRMYKFNSVWICHVNKHFNRVKFRSNAEEPIWKVQR